jgi:hypothetical protein
MPLAPAGFGQSLSQAYALFKSDISHGMRNSFLPYDLWAGFAARNRGLTKNGEPVPRGNRFALFS